MAPPKLESAVNLGHGHRYVFVAWSPDRDLNHRYRGVPDIERAGAIIEHRRPDGELCTSSIMFDLPEVRAIFGDQRPYWQVVSMQPLHIEPSLLCGTCGDHGWIRGDAWVPA